VLNGPAEPIGGGDPVADLTLTPGRHSVEFVVEQTGERHVVEYAADGRRIDAGTVRYAGRFGGPHLADVLRTIGRERWEHLPVGRTPRA
jgi:hypothetical protein